jgi:hypothetical protein
MEKFLSIPVTGEKTQLISCTDVKLVEQASTTTVTLTYGGGKKNNNNLHSGNRGGS